MFRRLSAAALAAAVAAGAGVAKAGFTPAEQQYGNPLVQAPVPNKPPSQPPQAPSVVRVAPPAKVSLRNLPPAPPSSVLPFTGLNLGGVIGIAAALVVLGVVLVGVARRRAD